MRELRRIHKGELKEANKLASKILQQMDQLEKTHDNEKQVKLSNVWVKSDTICLKAYERFKIGPGMWCIYIYAALEMFPNKGPRVIGDLGLSSLEVGFTYFYLASSIKFMNPSQSVFKIRQKLLFQTQINHIYHLYNGTQRQK